MSPLGEKLLVRLTGVDAEGAVRVAQDLGEKAGGFVVGADLLLGYGPVLVGALCALEKPVLVDLGTLDRPPVVTRVVSRMGKLGARWVSVSGLGGRAVLEAAVAEAREYPDTEVVVSAALSGWAREDELKGVGIADTPGRQVSRMTRLADKSGARGIVFPARELGVVVQVSENSDGFLRMAEITERLSSFEKMKEVAGIITGGAHWVIAPQDEMGREGLWRV